MKAYLVQNLKELAMKMSSAQRDEFLVSSWEMYEPFPRPRILNNSENTPIEAIFKPIPNVRNFKIKLLSEPHPVFQKHGKMKREFAPIIEWETHSNKRIIRYINHQLERLRMYKHNPKLFTRIAWHLMMSKTYQVACLQHVFQGWHRSKPYGEIKALMRRVAKELEQQRKQAGPMQFRRKYIPKPNGKMRGLGIPSPHWRIILHGWNTILTIWFENKQSANQHGFWPTRGTTTAWKQIHKEVIPARNIYEFDLERFFDSVNLTYLHDLLINDGMDPELVSVFDAINRTLPSKEDAIDMTWETEEDKLRDFMYWKTRVWIPDMSSEIVKAHANALYEEEMKVNPAVGEWEFHRGVAPGSPLSPLLSSILLHGNLLRDWGNPAQICQYADDGIIYNHNDPEKFLSELPPESGIKVNPTKSQWIKKDGEWLAPLKFLGVKFVPKKLMTPAQLEMEMRQDGILENATRELKEITFQEYDMIEEAYIYDMKRDQSSKRDPGGLNSQGQTWSEWFDTTYMGYVMSQIYKGEEGMKKIQNFEYTFRPGSWAHLEDKRGPKGTRINGHDKVTLTIHNSSTFACEALYKWMVHEKNVDKGLNLRC